MSPRVTVSGLSVERELFEFVRDEALPGSGLTAERFWEGAAAIFRSLGPRRAALLAERDRLQAQLDDFHRAHPGRPDPQAYRDFLQRIGYLLPEPTEVRITTRDVDEEVSRLAGPQLVVPALNARFATNAANARWGSLYDALYGSDALGQPAPGGYDPVHGAAVIARVRAFLDDTFPLVSPDGRPRSHASAACYRVADGALRVDGDDGEAWRLADASEFVGYTGSPESPETVLLRHHGLHIELRIDRTHPVGGADLAGVADVIVEAALTAIIDLEDSVAAVDGADKTVGYRHWLQLNAGTLEATVQKNGRRFVRRMQPDRRYLSPDGTPVQLHGRALLFVRHVGHLMTTDAVLDENGNEVSEGILDALVTALGSLRDLRAHENERLRNSRTGSMYVVKPKLHGPEEVALAVDTFACVEELLGLPARTIKIGLMDEERRTSVNLAACVAAASDRIVFVNTGFLDRTGDEIHTSLHAGAVERKSAMRSQPFTLGYEDHNVDVALRSGFSGRAQIGKGMWAIPGHMAAMLEQKSAHPRAGASTAWVPSPTAAVLHALHYHEVDVVSRQAQLSARTPTGIEPLLELPLADTADWSTGDVREELDDNVQSILGYVVRWVDQGIGCSTVPDIHGVGLMEDRATLRISSQLLANWLTHGVISEADVVASLHRMARIVDHQNAEDAEYEPLAPGGVPGLAFRAAERLILEGARQPNGYTEPILHSARRARKETRAGGPLSQARSGSAS